MAGPDYSLDGETRVFVIIGDPIAQVKSPGGITKALHERGQNAVLIPAHVAPGDFSAYVKGVSVARNVDGIVVTVPHKFAAHAHCASTSKRAQLLGAVNVMRRNADNTWHGDMCDGEGFVQGIRRAGCSPEGKRALLAGAGGAGSAIALALLENRVSELAIHDDDPARRDALIERLASRFGSSVHAGSSDPRGFEVIVNATPSGMRDTDALPVQTARLDAGMFVGDVITVPELTPLLVAARAVGCTIQTGVGMFDAVRDLIVAFLLEGKRDAGH